MLLIRSNEIKAILWEQNGIVNKYLNELDFLRNQAKNPE